MQNATKSKELQQGNKTYHIELNYVQYQGRQWRYIYIYVSKINNKTLTLQNNFITV